MAIGGAGVANVATPPVGLEAFRDYASDLRDGDKLQETLDQIEREKSAAIQAIEQARDTMLTVAEEKQSEAVTARNEALAALQTAREEADGIVGAAKTQAAQIVDEAKTSAADLTKGARSASTRATNKLNAATEKEAANRRAAENHQTKVDTEHQEIADMRSDLEAREGELAEKTARIKEFVSDLKTSVTEMFGD